MAIAAVDYARQLALPEVVGFTLITNLASQRVLEKAGLVFECVLEHAGFPHWFTSPAPLATEPARQRVRRRFLKRDEARVARRVGRA
jgi:RimJ/RimL family protein N-acetyltransferase